MDIVHKGVRSRKAIRDVIQRIFIQLIAGDIIFIYGPITRWDNGLAYDYFNPKCNDNFRAPENYLGAPIRPRAVVEGR